MPVFNTFDQVIDKAKQLGKRKIALVQADSPLLIGALKQAMDIGIVEPTLIGKKDAIEKIAGEINVDLAGYTVIDHQGSDEDAVKIAVELVHAGEAHLLMKGQLHTATYLRGILSKESKLKVGDKITHVAFAQMPSYHKIFGGTDGGVVLHPTFEEKITIIKNAVMFFRLLGYEKPKVGLLAYSEDAKENDPETYDWVKMVKLAEAGEFGEVEMAGPMGFDLLFDKESVKIKGYKSPVAADVDIYVAPYITACNASIKAIYLNGGQAAGMLVGTKIPVMMLSRSDSEKTRLNSMAIGALAAHGIEQKGGWE